MSTPQTLTQAVPPHQHHLQQRYLPSPQDRYLPPPRPSSNLSFHQSLPGRPSSNISNHQFQPPPYRPQSGMSNGGYAQPAHAHGQARAGAEQYSYGLSHQSSHEELRRTNSRTSQHSRQLPPLPAVPPQQSQLSRGSAASAISQTQMPTQRATGTATAQQASDDRNRKRGRQSPVDWVEYFGGKPPAEIITIHDDDSPAPAAEVSKLPGPTTAGSSAHHVGKKRRTEAGSGAADHSTTNTPYSYSNGASTESLQNTTAPTSLGSAASSGSRLEGAQTGQKRKRTTRTSEQDRKKQETEKKGPRGYLAEYGEYVPPPKQTRKQKEVHVPPIHEVRLTQQTAIKSQPANDQTQRHKPTDKIDDEDGHYIVQENSRLGERYSLVQLLGQGTFGKVVKALDIRTRREVAVKIIRAVPKVRSRLYSHRNDFC